MCLWPNPSHLAIRVFSYMVVSLTGQGVTMETFGLNVRWPPNLLCYSYSMMVWPLNTCRYRYRHGLLLYDCHNRKPICRHRHHLDPMTHPTDPLQQVPIQAAHRPPRARDGPPW